VREAEHPGAYLLRKEVADEVSVTELCEGTLVCVEESAGNRVQWSIDTRCNAVDTDQWMQASE
jgi:hypothetical protein